MLEFFRVTTFRPENNKEFRKFGKKLPLFLIVKRFFRTATQYLHSIFNRSQSRIVFIGQMEISQLLNNRFNNYCQNKDQEVEKSRQLSNHLEYIFSLPRNQQSILRRLDSQCQDGLASFSSIYGICSENVSFESLTVPTRLKFCVLL